MTDKNFTYRYFVEYIENGIQCSDTWSERTLNEELNRNEVTITHIELAWSVQVALGLVEEN